MSEIKLFEIMPYNSNKCKLLQVFDSIKFLTILTLNQPTDPVPGTSVHGTSSLTLRPGISIGIGFKRIIRGNLPRNRRAGFSYGFSGRSQSHYAAAPMDTCSVFNCL